MAESIHKVHEMINKVGFEFDEATAKKVTQLAEKAGKLAADNMTHELSSVVGEIGAIFNKTLAKLGKQQIDLTDMIKMPDRGTIGKLTSSFVSEIASSISVGINEGLDGGDLGLNERLKELKAERKRLTEEYEQIQKTIKNKTEIERINKQDVSEPLKVSGDLKSEAKRVREEFIQAYKNIYDFDMDTPEYTKAVLEAQEKANQLQRMQHTIRKGMLSELSQERKEYETLMDNQVIEVADSFDEISEGIDAAADLQQIEKSLKRINTEIEEIINKAKGSKSTDGSIFKDIINDERDLEKARQRMQTKKGDAYTDKKVRDLNALTSDEPIKITESLEKLKFNYDKAVNTEQGWEVEYQWLIKFIKKYDELQAKGRNKEQLESFKGVYDSFMQQYPEAVSSLKELRTLVETTPPSRNKATTQSQEGGEPIPSEDIANAEKLAEANRKAAEEAERKAKAEREAAEAAQQAAEATERERLTKGATVKEDKSSYATGSILDNPMFANMFGGEKGDDTSAGPEQVNESLEEQSGLLTNIGKLTSYIDEEYLSVSKHLSDFLDDLQKESVELDGELKNILSTLNLIDASGKPTFDVKRNGEDGGGTTHSGALISDDFVLIERANYEKVKDSKLPTATQKASDEGVNVAKVLGYIKSKTSNAFFDVQTPAKGHNLFENGVLSQDVVNATEDQLEQLVRAFVVAREHGFNIENGGSNIVYDKEKGFSFYDLEDMPQGEIDEWNKLSSDEKTLDALYDMLRVFTKDNRDYTDLENDPNREKLFDRIRQIIEDRKMVDPKATSDLGNYEDVINDILYETVDTEEDLMSFKDEMIAKAKKKATVDKNVDVDDFLNNLFGDDDDKGDVDARRQELIADLDKYSQDVLTSKDADDNLQKMEETYNALKKEGLLTEELEESYNRLNQKLEKRANLLRQAEGYYDDVDGVLGDQRVDSIDSADQYRKEHIKPFDDTVASMRDSGLFSDDELDKFEQISKSMEDRFKQLPFDELSSLYVDPDSISDLNELNELLEKRRQIMQTAGDTAMQQHDLDQYAEELKLNEAIEERINLLQMANTQKQQDADNDDSEIIRRENGALEEKLELLRDIAEEYGRDITQKDRNRYEELNQKEMNDGLTPKEEDRFFDLGDKIDEADQALMEFGETYDRIVLKLANGKKVEILPDDKGLRSLYNFADGFGEEYNGVEIEDVSFERVRKEAIQAEQAVEDLNNTLKETNNLGQGSGTGDASSAEVERLQAELKAAEEHAENLDYQLNYEKGRTDFEREQAEAEARARREAEEELARMKADADGKKLVDKDAPDNADELIALRAQLEVAEDALSNESYHHAQARSELYNQIDNAEFERDKAIENQRKAEEEVQRLKEQIAKVHTTPMDTGTSGGIGTADIDAEESQLKTLRETIEAVVTAVNLKTKAFHNEGEVVSQVVGKEINALMKLNAQATEVSETISKLLANVKTVVDVSNASKGINISVKTSTDDGGIKKTPTKTKDKTPSTNKGELKQLEKQYEELGRLWARLDKENYPTQSALIENLEDEIRRKQETLGLTKMETEALKEKMDIAEKAEERVIQGEREAEEIKKATEENLKFARSVKDLGTQYEKLGKLQAQAEAGDLGKAEEAKQLEKVVRQETEKLKLNEAQNAEILKSLQLRQQEAKTNKSSVLTAKEQKKDEDKAWRDQVKAARGYSGVNAANSAVATGNRVVANVIGDESITSDIEAKARELQNAIKTLSTLKDDINRGIAKGEEVDSDGLARQTAKVKELTAEMNDLLAIHQKYSGDNATVIEGDAGSFSNLGLDEYEKQLTKMAETSVGGRLQNVKFNAETKELTATVKTGANAFTTYSFAVDQVDNKLKQLNQGTKKTETFMEGVMRKTKELAQYALGSISIYDVFNQVRQGIQYIKEIDSALVELKKVTDETEGSYDRFLDTASKTAGVIGSTISDFTRATATFAKLGYDMNMASEMAEAAVVYQNVGDGIESADAAAESIISTIKGFNLEASESMRIVDSFNEVGNRFSITSKGIGDALQRSASALSAGGNTLDESIGLITAANEVVQDPTSVGTALKTLSLRLRGAKTELEEAGLETENMAETTAVLQQKLLALTGGKVDIMLDADTFKNSTQILREMSGAWEDMTDIQQAAALELMGGKRQANILSSIIQNFDTVESVIEASANSSNSALEENAKWMDSIEGRISQFTNAYQTMWNNMLGSGTIKGIVDLGTGLVKIVDTLGLIPSILVTIGSFKILQSVFKGFSLSSLVNDIKDLTMGTKVLDATTRKATFSLMAEQLQFNLASSSLVEYAIKMGLATTADVAKMTTTQLLGLAFKALGAAIWSATKAIVSFLLTNPVGWAILLAGALTGVVAVFNHFHKSTEELKEELHNLKSELSEIQSELDSLNTGLETTQSRMAELLAMDSLSFTEQEELKNLQKQNNELERQIYLLEQRQKRKQKETEETFKELMGDEFNNGTSQMGVSTGITEKQVLDSYMSQYEKNLEQEEQAEEALVIAEESENEKEIKKAEEKLKKAEKQTQTTREYIDEKLEEYADAAEGIDYDLADDETKEYLDYVYDLEDRFNIINGDDKAKEIGIKGVFNKEEFSDEAEQINKYVEALKDGNTSATQSIQNIINSNGDLKEALSNKGLVPQDAVDYFTQIGSNGVASIDEMIEKIEQAKSTLEDLLNGTGPVKIDALFDADGNVDQIELSKVFQGTDEETRKNLTSVLKNAYEQIKDGTLDIEDLLIQFGVKSSQQVADAIKNSLPDMEDFNSTIDSIQDAYSTLTDVVKQYNSTGYLTLDNLQALLSLEPEYLAALQMEGGQLSINQSILEAMIQTKLAEAKATAVQSAITELNALAARTEADAINASSNAAINAISGLGSYASALGVVAQDAIAAAGAVTAFNAAVRGAQNNEFVSQADIDKVLSNFNTKISLIDSVGKNLPKSFGSIVSPKSSGGSSKGDTALEKIQKYYERQIKNLEGQQTYIENEIEKLEAQEEGVSADYYEKQIDLEEEKITLYQQEREELLKLKRTDEVADAIWEIEHAIQESTLRMIEFRKSIAELYATASENITEAYDRRQQLSDDKTSFIENEISIRETKGELVPTSAYDDLIAEARTKKANAEEELNAQANLYWQGINSGDFEEDSDEALDIIEKIRQKKLDMQEASKQEAEYIEQQKDAYIAYYDKMMEAYSYRNDFIQGQSDFAQSYIDRLGVLNINVPDEAYEKIAEIQELSAAGLREQLEFANSELAKFEAQGIDKNDPRYIEKFNEALALEKEIYDKETEVYETHQQIFDNQIDRFNQVIDRINDATQKLQNISGLVDNEDVATEDGEWTAEGLTQLGMAYQQMEYYKQSADEIAEKMAEVEEAYKRGEISEKKYYETMQELENQQWDTINSYKDMEDTIVDLNEARIDMIEQGLDKEIEAMEELIQLKRDELDAERDLFDFKKDVEKQTKDIAALERRIASMGGSSDASTIAERTKLEQQLREAKEGLDDTFYNHAMDSQSNALDDELKKFTESSEDYLESLRESIKDTDLLIETTFTDVMQNGQIVLETLTTLSNTYGFQLDGYLTSPWVNATNKSIDFDTYATQHFNAVYTAVETKTSDLTGYLKTPWEKGQEQASTFSIETQKYMSSIVSYAETEYKTQLQKKLDYPWLQANGQASWGKGIKGVLDQAVKDAQEAGRKIAEALDVEPPSYEGSPTNSSNTGGYTPKPAGGGVDEDVKTLQSFLNEGFGAGLTKDGKYGPATKAAMKKVQEKIGVKADGWYGSDTRDKLIAYWDKKAKGDRQNREWWDRWKSKLPAAMYAKGTMGTTKDQFAITDESWIGEEITLAAGKNGQLQYLKKGSAVMPADISANLVEWGKLDPTMMSIGDMSSGVQLMSNYVNKPEIKIDVENFLKVDRVDQDSLPQLEKLMDKKIDTFAKQLNASIRKFK